MNIFRVAKSPFPKVNSNVWQHMVTGFASDYIAATKITLDEKLSWLELKIAKPGISMGGRGSK